MRRIAASCVINRLKIHYATNSRMGGGGAGRGEEKSVPGSHAPGCAVIAGNGKQTLSEYEGCIMHI